MPAIRTTKAGIPVPVIGIMPGLPGIVAGTVSGRDAPQLVQNFWTENSNSAPHFEQNLRAMIV
jgi:hypothetical protein